MITENIIDLLAEEQDRTYSYTQKNFIFTIIISMIIRAHDNHDHENLQSFFMIVITMNCNYHEL